MNDNIYTKKSSRFALPQFQMLGIVLLLPGVIYAFQLNPWSLLLLFVGIVLATMSTGIQIDFENRKHRDYIVLLGFKSGKWVDIPPLDYVTMYVEHLAQDMAVVSINRTDHETNVKISLIVSEQQRFDAGSYKSKEEAFEVAENIARKFGCRLLDFTTPEAKWVDLKNL